MSRLNTEEPGDGVVLVRWDDGENRLNLDSLGEWHELLDDLVSREGPLALVVTGTGKFFSNGLDLDRFSEAPDESGPIVEGTHRLLGRLLLLPAWTVFAEQFRSPLIFILLVAFVVTVILGELVDAAVIATVLVLNAVIGFTQERKAEGAVRSLMQLVVPRARVVRDGRDHEIDSRELVPGDVVLLESGMRIPADLRLVSVACDGVSRD